MARVQHDQKESAQGKPLAVEYKMFFVGTIFFVPIAIVYPLVADFEPIGTTAFIMLVLMWAMVGGYLWLVGKRTTPRPEDDTLGDIEERAGEAGTFAPHSWWPLVLGAGTALAFLGVAVGWWITGIGAVVAVIGLIGISFEFSAGQHAH